MEVDETQRFLREHFPVAAPVDRDQAETAAVIHASTAKLGISYADSICLALGVCLNLPIYTADQRWAGLELDFDVRFKMIR
jgi:PIN domain nuclease of toxin-antitoxin system